MLIQLNVFLSLAISFTIVYFVIPKIVKISNSKNLFDVPNHRSAAKKATPRLGGVAIFAAFFISLIVSSENININELKYLLAGIIAMFIIGMKDDFIGLAARKKFAIQLITALYLVIFGKYQITNLHGLFGIYEIHSVSSVVLSTLIFVGIINSINLIDGIDGLASGISLLITTIYGSYFLISGDVLYAITCFSLSGALIAFFLYNVFGRKNKIFMGDTGSLVLGIIVAAVTIRFNEFTPSSSVLKHGLPAISFAIIMVPVIDTIRVFAIRISQKKSPFTPDMNHIHHKLLKLTNSHISSTAILMGTNLLLVLAAFSLIDTIGNAYLFLLLAVVGFILASLPALILKLQTKKPKNIPENHTIDVFSLILRKFRA